MGNCYSRNTLHKLHMELIHRLAEVRYSGIPPRVGGCAESFFKLAQNRLGLLSYCMKCATPGLCPPEMRRTA